LPMLLLTPGIKWNVHCWLVNGVTQISVADLETR
jgi:hypothetical protein